MSEPENGSKDRATVALVLSEIKGLRDFSDAKFTDVQRQLDTLSGLPIVVNGLLERVKQHDDALREIDEREEKRRAYRIGPLVGNLIGFVGIIVAAVAVLVSHAG